MGGEITHAAQRVEQTRSTARRAFAYRCRGEGTSRRASRARVGSCSSCCVARRAPRSSRSAPRRRSISRWVAANQRITACKPSGRGVLAPARPSVTVRGTWCPCRRNPECTSGGHVVHGSGPSPHERPGPAAGCRGFSEFKNSSDQFPRSITCTRWMTSISLMARSRSPWCSDVGQWRRTGPLL